MPDKNLKVENYGLAVVSTSCLLPATVSLMEELAGDSARFGGIVASFDEGFFVSCQRTQPGDPCPAGCPQDLHALRCWVVQQGYQYVMLDRDADVPEGAPDYSAQWA